MFVAFTTRHCQKIEIPTVVCLILQAEPVVQIQNQATPTQYLYQMHTAWKDRLLSVQVLEYNILDFLFERFMFCLS